MFRLHILICLLIIEVSVLPRGMAEESKVSETSAIQIPTTALMVRKNNDNWEDFTSVGTIATALQICEVFNHSFFKGPTSFNRST